MVVNTGCQQGRNQCNTQTTSQLPVEILQYLGLSRVRLLSNNPEKIQALEKAGIEVSERISCEVAPVDASELYLRTKKEKLGHLLEGF